MSILSAVAAVSPFGPIFGKELRTTSRRKRSYLLRVSYLGLLLLCLLMAWVEVGFQTNGSRAMLAMRQAELGTLFFGFFSMFCVCAMGLIGPVLTCTSIGSERLAKTLPVLLMTPINAWQIVAGKLFSRMLVSLTLLGLSLPVLALVRLLGGVELEQMLAVLCICTSLALSSAAIGLFFSSLMTRAFAVILLSYGVQGFFYGMIPFVLAEARIIRGPGAAAWIGTSNPIFAVFLQVTPRMSGLFPGSWVWCVISQVAMAAVFTLGSGLLLRRTFRRAGQEPSAGNPESDIPFAAAESAPMSTRADGAAPTDALSPGPLLGDRGAHVPSGGRSAKLSEVSDYPILWRELRRPLLARRWQRVVCVVICIVLLLIAYATLAAGLDLEHADTQIGFAFIFNGLAWLLISVLSATAIATEKESDTWTLLLTVPVSGSAVVWGKVGGLLRRMMWPLALVTSHFLLFTVTGVIRPQAIILILWVLITFNSVWIATGLWLSLRLKKVTFAVIANLMLAVLTYFLPLVSLGVLNALLGGNGRMVENAGWHIPYVYLAVGLKGIQWSSRQFYLPGNRVSGEVFFLTVFVIGALHLVVACVILQIMATDFDRIVGRAGRQRYNF